MVDFAVHAMPLRGLGIKVAAVSVDPIDNVAALKSDLRVGYPMYGDLDAAAVAETHGVMTQPRGDTTITHATGFLLAPDGTVNTAVYSSGPIGRFTPSEILRKVAFEQAQS